FSYNASVSPDIYTLSLHDALPICIGSGKTKVSDLFADLGIDIVDADLLAREVVEPGTPALKEITEHFGAEILQADGQLDRRALRDRKSTRLNSSHVKISYAVFCLK